MRGEISLSIIVISLFLVSACVPTTEETPVPDPIEQRDTVPVETVVVAEPEQESEPEPEPEMTQEVIDLLNIADSKVKSYQYEYKGPETDNFNYKFLVKGDKVKYVLFPTSGTLDLDDDAFDAIYLDNTKKTAQAYCDDRRCRTKGWKKDMNYEEAHILTPLEWIGDIEFAEKTGEEKINNRATWKLETKNKDTIWVDSFFGVPLETLSGELRFQFQHMTFNDVKDEDVVPKTD